MKFTMRMIWLVALGLSTLAGCAVLDEKQRTWIFQPGDRSWGSSATYADGMQRVWIPFDSRITGKPVKLHALFHAADAHGATGQASAAPVLLYLHGARWNVEGSSARIRRMQELGFSVLAIDYRGFGKTSAELPSEDMAYEDARAAWDWMARQYPGRQRFIFGHSLGGAIAIDLAAQVTDESGTIVEGTFTSIADVFGSLKWGWLPIGGLITQPFDAASKVARIGSPLLVVHGSEDSTIKPELGRRLFEVAQHPKAFVMVDGGSHFSTNSVGQGLYREAMARLFGTKLLSPP
jgi:uncharacterized protein